MEEYLTPEEVAERLKVSVETVWRWCREGFGSKFGRTYRITPADIEAWGNREKTSVAV